MVDSIKLTGDADVIVNGIDYVGDIGYTYEMKRYENVIVALPISVINTPKNIESLKEFRSTLKVIYYIKVVLCRYSIVR
jgi:hypothetical protein